MRRVKHLPLIVVVAFLPSVVTAALLLSDPGSVSVVLLAVGTGALVGMLLFWPHLRDLETIRDHINRLLSEASPSRPASKGGSDTSHALSTLRHLWRRKIQDAEGRLASTEAVLDILPDPLLILSDQRRILRANRAAIDLLGPEGGNAEIAGRDVVELIRTHALIEAFESLVEGTTTIWDFPVSLSVSDSSVPPSSGGRDFQARLAPLSTRSIDEAVATLTLHDITSVKNLDRLRADFVANASHELRTPLTSFLGFTETLQGPARDDPDAQQHFLGLMYEQGQRMTRLVDDLLSLSRIEMNEHLPPSETIGLSTVLKTVIEGLQVQAKRKAMTIDLVLPDPVPPVLGQQGELIQVFQNLLDNAIKYGAAETVVTVTVQAYDAPDLPVGTVAVSVRDRGEGIAAHHLPRLTERFFRVDSARSKQLGGTGLGLAIVKHIVNRHRGRLVIESTVGEGSTFTVFLPKAHEAASSAAVEDEPSSSS